MTKIIRYISLLIIFGLGSATARALDLGTYADTSVLAEGTWVKVAVATDGLYAISPAQLRAWGIDPQRAVVRGYGGRRIPQALTRSNFVDDLPVAPCDYDERLGLVFFGAGSGEWKTTTTYDRYWFQQNDYTPAGYYYVGQLPEGETRAGLTEYDGTHLNGTPHTTFTERVQYERELTPVPGEAGPALLGEDFRYTTRRSFSFKLKGIAPDATIWLRTSFVSNTSAPGQLNFKVNGTGLEYNTSDRVAQKSSNQYVFANHTESTHTFDYDGKGEDMTVEMQFTGGGAVSGAWLNFMTVNYTRPLALPSEGYLIFSSPRRNLSFDGVAQLAGLRVWDVTNPVKPLSMKTAAEGPAVQWCGLNMGNMAATYAVWSPAASLPAPVTVGTVANQNLHAHSDFDMVIVSPAAFAEQARRLADFHANGTDSLRVAVVTPDEIYNEFSSGSADPGALRRYFKMLHDRSLLGDHPLRYVILFGRTTQDNRGITAGAPSYPTIPSWMPEGVAASLSDNSGYCTDDVTAMLDDGSGSALTTSKLTIAIGRIPVTSLASARDVVDKLLQYATKSKKSAWKHRFMFLADDQDQGAHLTQTENLIKQYEASGGDRMLPRKVYLDSYTFVGDRYPDARAAMFRALEEGVVWWNFVGHANTSGWTHEHQLSYADINQLYLRHWPFIYAATCEFLRIDGSSVSGGELMFLQRNGGAVGMLSAVRPVYISNNGLLSSAMGRAMAMKDDKGRPLPPGEICRRAKNDIRNLNNDRVIADDNRLRYTFIGDPALPLALPAATVVVDSIKGISLADPEAQPTLAALERATVTGYIVDPMGQPVPDFDGILTADIFDAEHTVTTNGRGDAGKVDNFEDIGSRIFAGSTTVTGGRFRLDVAMPQEISQNFRPATMSLYAYADDSDDEAIGLCRSFYVYGYDDSADPDTTPPAIESFVLNHEDFRSGDAVNPSPILLARLSDDVGINVSSAGIGHQMTAIIDGTLTYTDLSDYYTPSPDGTPSGTLAYPFENLQPGSHTLTLRVWDTSGNVGEATVDFTVVEGMAPKLYEVYSDANPASTVANFYLTHNQPETNATVTVTVYNLVGTPIWSGQASGRSEMFTTVPVSWDLTDTAGRRVARGIYLYRATISTDGGNTYETASRRLAVTAQ